VTIAFNVVAVAVSVAAFGTSLYTNRRQIHSAEGGNQLPVVMEAFQTSRAPGWVPAEEYILTRLAIEHPSDGGHRALPHEVREHTHMIGLFYDDLGKLVAHRIVDKRLVIGAYGGNIVRLWDVLAPYVYAERRLRGTHFWVYFENLAAVTAETPPESVYARLRSRPPKLRPS
jgi:hypothetical protein